MLSRSLLDEDDNTNVWDQTEAEDPEADAEAAANDAAAEAAIAAMSASKPVQSNPAKADSDRVFDEDYMDDEDRRMSLAGYYREFVSNPLFDNGDEDAELVEREIRQFVKGRIRILMGMKADAAPAGMPVKLPFNEAEIQTIKSLANASQSLLGLTETFAPRELVALKALAAVALRQKGMVPTPAAQDKPKARPTMRRTQAPTPIPVPIVVAPPPPPVVVVAPPTPAPKPSFRRAVGRPAQARTTASRAEPAATAAPIKPLTKQVVQEVNGQEHVTTVPIQTSHPNRVPFPRTDRDFQATADVFAANQARSHAINAENQDKVSVGHR